MTRRQRFEVIYEESATAERTRILRDGETGVCYLFHWLGTGGGLTVLLDQDGKPVVMQGPDAQPR